MYQQLHGDNSARNGFYTLLIIYLSFPRAALAKKMSLSPEVGAKVANRKIGKTRSFAFLLFQSGQRCNYCSNDDQTHTKRKELFVIGAFSTSII